jgi:hypothetical protein
MNIFQELGWYLDGEFRRAEYDEEAFPEIAVSALEKFRVDREVTSGQIAQWYFSGRPSVGQPRTNSEFGEPPLNVFVNDRLYIETIFWMDGVPSIHQHSFAGAFQVLEGGSIHTNYAFHLRKRLGWSLLAGDLELQKAERLRKGDIRAILPGNRFIHGLFHLDRPSLTLVARTPGFDPAAHPQFGYLKPHFGLTDDRTGDERMYKRNQLIPAMYAQDKERCRDLVRELARQETFEAVFKFAATLHKLDKPAALDLLADQRGRYGELVDLAVVTLEQAERDDLVRRRRRTVRNLEHRFFLAVLLNTPHRQAALQMVADFYPGDPVDNVMRWLRELAGQANDAGSNPLGIPLGPTSLDVIDWRLRHEAPFPAWLRRERHEGDIEDAQGSLQALWEALQDISVLRSLFVRGPSASAEALTA